jgi:hypothetical protein
MSSLFKRLKLLTADTTTAFNRNNYPVKFTITMSKWDNLTGFIEFWRYVRNTAAGGHSFTVEADRESKNSAPKAKFEIDGDGADHIGQIFLNDLDITEDKSGKKTKRAIQSVATNKLDLSKLSNDEIAVRVQNEKLSQEERTAAYDEFKRRGLLRPRRRPKQRAWNRASVLANDNSHSTVIESLMNAGYRYHGKKIGDKLTTHTLKYHSKATPEHNARIKNMLTQYGFTHTKTPKGHDFRRPDAHVRIESVPGATRLQYIHRNASKEIASAIATALKFKVGDRVRRNPKIWNKSNPYDVGTVIKLEQGKNNKNKMVNGYRVVADPDKNGTYDEFTNKMGPPESRWYAEDELISYVKNKK